MKNATSKRLTILFITLLVGILCLVLGILICDETIGSGSNNNNSTNSNNTYTLYSYGKTVDCSADKYYTFEFKPSSSGYYKFYTSGTRLYSSDSYISVKKEGYGTVSFENNAYSNPSNINIEVYLYSGYTYTFKVKAYYNGSFTAYCELQY